MAKELTDFRRGDTKKIKIDYGVGFDITGYRFWFTLKAAFEDVTPIAQVITNVGDHPLDEPLNGIAYIQLESNVSKLIPIGKYFWDIQRRVSAAAPFDILTIAPSNKNQKVKIEVLNDVTLVDA